MCIFNRLQRNPLILLLFLAYSTTPPLMSQETVGGSNKSTQNHDQEFELVIHNLAQEPRSTPYTRRALKQYIEHLKIRTPRIPLPEQSDTEEQLANNEGRMAGYEARLRSLYLNENATSGYMVFGGRPLSSSSSAVAGAQPPTGRASTQVADPNLSLDYAFKVRMFWIAARANNCQYCLGHQESKLLAAGMLEDEIAALDCDWSKFPESERVAFELALKLTRDPHLLGPQDIEACRKFYTDLQILEMIGSVAGNNAINRWKEGAGIPQSTGGGNFGRRGSGGITGSGDAHSYLTPTSMEYATKPSKIVAARESDLRNSDVAFTRVDRPALEMGSELEMKLKEVADREPLLPLVSEEEARQLLGDTNAKLAVPQWKRLLLNFPVAGKRLIDSVESSSEPSELSLTLQSKIDWVVARQDRAWYNAALALEEMRNQGTSEEEIGVLDSDLSTPNSILEDRERLLLNVAIKLAASPIVLSDKEVADAVEKAGPKAVTQLINYTAYRAMLNRITEAARLSK